MKLQFNYLYRDRGNYKKWSHVVFSNPDSLTIEDVGQILRGCFLEDVLFIAAQVRLPEVFLFTRGDATSDDHCFHEFLDVTASSEPPNDDRGRSVSEFLVEVRREAKRGWKAFDPHDALLQRARE
jgi:hypothetical protein